MVILAAVVALGFLVFDSNTLFFYPSLVYAEQNSNLVITHGVASGDVTDNSAIIWSRANKEALMHVEYDTNSNFTSSSRSFTTITTTVNETTDFTGHIRIDGLAPDSQYYYRVWFSGQNKEGKNSESQGSEVTDSITGAFRTAPEQSASKKTVSFVVGGDLGGQRYCKRVDLGYPIFSIMKALSPDFFIFNGDQIYGDDVCPASLRSRRCSRMV